MEPCQWAARFGLAVVQNSSLFCACLCYELICVSRLCGSYRLSVLLEFMFHVCAACYFSRVCVPGGRSEILVVLFE